MVDIKKIKFRLATIDDAEQLLIWRNDNLTRKYSHNTKEINKEEHIEWLSKTLNNKMRKLYIAEYNDLSIGTIRLDYLENACELSWTVAPDQRNYGYGKAIVKAMANQMNGPVFAEVKKDNEASKKIAENAGMVFQEEKNGILYYSRS